VPVYNFNGSSIKVTGSAISVLERGIARKVYDTTGMSHKELFRLLYSIVTEYKDFRGKEGEILEVVSPKLGEIFKSIVTSERAPDYQPVRRELFIGIGNRTIQYVQYGTMHVLATVDGFFIYPTPYQFEGGASLAMLCLRAGWYFDEPSPWCITVREGKPIISDVDSLLDMEDL